MSILYVKVNGGWSWSSSCQANPWWLSACPHRGSAGSTCYSLPSIYEKRIRGPDRLRLVRCFFNTFAATHFVAYCWYQSHGKGLSPGTDRTGIVMSWLTGTVEGRELPRKATTGAWQQTLIFGCLSLNLVAYF